METKDGGVEMIDVWFSSFHCNQYRYSQYIFELFTRSFALDDGDRIERDGRSVKSWKVENGSQEVDAPR